MTTKKKKTTDVTDRFTAGDILRFTYEISEGGSPLRGSNIPGRNSLVTFIGYGELAGQETIIARWHCLVEHGDYSVPNVIEFPTLNRDCARTDGTAIYMVAEKADAHKSSSEPLDAAQVLEKVKGHLEERGRRYGAENGKERQFDRVADAFNIVRSSANRQNMPLTGLDVVTLQSILKICRAQTDDNTDSFEDLAGYAAIGAEVVGGMK